MKLINSDIVMVPGYTNSGADHWQSRWEEKMPSVRRVNQDDWHKPVVEDWTANFVSAIGTDAANTVVVAHSLGCQVVVQAMEQLSEAQKKTIAGAFLVAPPDVENPQIRPKHLMTFGPYPRDPLPFPSMVVASQNDSFCTYEKAGDMANAWGSLLVDARESGHINTESGHGPWPDGLMLFGKFLSRLDGA
ncbi:MAG: alpha/beta hydrolase [Pseudomonadota bacterium]